MGQVYVLFSRVTDPGHLELIGHRVDTFLCCNAHRHTYDICEAYLRQTFLKTWLALGELLDWMWPNAFREQRL